MATTKKRLVSLLSNSTFTINYETSKLSPQIELVILTQEAEYKANQKGELIKGIHVGEFRIFTTSEGLTQMIGDLQTLAANLQAFEHMAIGFNGIIDQHKKVEESKKAQEEEKKED